MAERAETDLLARALNGLSKNAQRDLALVFLGYESNTELLKTEIPQVWESLLEKYGSASSELGARMFEQWAARIDIDSPEVKRVRAVDPERARARLEWALSSKSPRENLMVLVDELVKQPARRTLAASADANGVKFARVPSGSETCAFCFMLASRGAVYLSEATAGKMDKFHGKCDCQIVPVRGPQDYPEGYHPDAMYDAYARARDKVTPEGQPIRVNEVLSQMRLDLHDQLRDGVEPPDVKAARLAKEAEENLKALADAASVGAKAAEENQRQLEKVRAKARAEAEELARQVGLARKAAEEKAARDEVARKAAEEKAARDEAARKAAEEKLEAVEARAAKLEAELETELNLAEKAKREAAEKAKREAAEKAKPTETLAVTTEDKQRWASSDDSGKADLVLEKYRELLKKEAGGDWTSVHDSIQSEARAVERIAPNGQPDIFVERVVYDDFDDPSKKTVYHGTFVLPKELQGKGVATRVNAQMYSFYRSLGVPTVRTHANIDVGGYTWARQGFTWDEVSGGPAREQVRPILRRLKDVAKESGVDLSGELRRIEERIEAGDIPTPFELSEVGRSHQWDSNTGRKTWVGKDAMLASDWYGVKRLDVDDVEAKISDVHEEHSERVSGKLDEYPVKDEFRTSVPEGIEVLAAPEKDLQKLYVDQEKAKREAEEKPSEDTRAKPVGLSPSDSDEWDQAVEAMKTSPEAHKKFFMKHLDHLREKVASAVDLSGDDWYLVAKDKGPDRILRNPESMEGVVRNPAPPAQEEALDAYLSPTYTQINGLLRGDKLSPEAGARARKWIRDLDSYFENNATHLAGDHVMVRGLRKSDLPEGELDRYSVGNTVVQKAYLSTASTESVASGFGGDVKLFIKAPDGQKYLSGVGFNNEAVFPRGMGLKVVAREDIPGLTTVYAELVDAR